MFVCKKLLFITVYPPSRLHILPTTIQTLPTPKMASSCSDSTFGKFKWLHKKSGPLKQMMSPIRFQGGNDSGKGVDYFLGTAIPNTIGYPIAYSFTGLGSNQGGWFSKMGVASTKESDRVLGANYFLPMIDKDQKPMICSSDSEDGCGGAQMHTYIQQYPSKPMGLLPAVVDGITHMIPECFGIDDALTESKPKYGHDSTSRERSDNASTTFIHPLSLSGTNQVCRTVWRIGHL